MVIEEDDRVGYKVYGMVGFRDEFLVCLRWIAKEMHEVRYSWCRNRVLGRVWVYKRYKIVWSMAKILG